MNNVRNQRKKQGYNAYIHEKSMEAMNRIERKKFNDVRVLVMNIQKYKVTKFEQENESKRNKTMVRRRKENHCRLSL